MMLIGFLEENPIIVGFIVLVLLITVVPAGVALYKRHRSPADAEQAKTIRGPRETRFLGTQMDIAVLVLGLLLLLVLVHWLKEAFS